MDNEIKQNMAGLRRAGARKIFFGSRMETYYAATSTPNPPDLPIWWHPGSSFSSLRSGDYAERFIAGQYDAALLAHDDFTRLPRLIVEHIQSDQFVKISCTEIDLYVRPRFLATPSAIRSIAPGCVVTDPSSAHPRHPAPRHP